MQEPLIEAIRSDDESKLRVLANYLTKELDEPLDTNSYQFRQARDEIYLILLHKGITIDPKEMLQKITPIWLAVCLGKLNSVKALIAAGVNVDQCTDGRSAVWMAAYLDHEEILRELASKKPNFTFDSYSHTSPIILAIRKDNLNALQTMIAAGANVNRVRHWSAAVPVKVAASDNKSHFVRLLLEAGAELDQETTYSIISNSIKNKYFDTLKVLLETLNKRKTDIPLGMSRICDLIRANDTEALKILIKGGLNIDRNEFYVHLWHWDANDYQVPNYTKENVQSLILVLTEFLKLLQKQSPGTEKFNLIRKNCVEMAKMCLQLSKTHFLNLLQDIQKSVITLSVNNETLKIFEEVITPYYKEPNWAACITDFKSALAGLYLNFSRSITYKEDTQTLNPVSLIYYKRAVELDPSNYTGHYFEFLNTHLQSNQVASAEDSILSAEQTYFNKVWLPKIIAAIEVLPEKLKDLIDERRKAQVLDQKNETLFGSVRRALSFNEPRLLSLYNNFINHWNNRQQALSSVNVIAITSYSETCLTYLNKIREFLVDINKFDSNAKLSATENHLKELLKLRDLFRNLPKNISKELQVDSVKESTKSSLDATRP